MYYKVDFVYIDFGDESCCLAKQIAHIPHIVITFKYYAYLAKYGHKMGNGPNPDISISKVNDFNVLMYDNK